MLYFCHLVLISSGNTICFGENASLENIIFCETLLCFSSMSNIIDIILEKLKLPTSEKITDISIFTSAENSHWVFCSFFHCSFSLFFFFPFPLSLFNVTFILGALGGNTSSMFAWKIFRNYCLQKNAKICWWILIMTVLGIITMETNCRWPVNHQKAKGFCQTNENARADEINFILKAIPWVSL